MSRRKNGLLQFEIFKSCVDPGFWHHLSTLKLNKLKTDESPIPITGFLCAPISNSKLSSSFLLLAESLPSEASEQLSTEIKRSGNRNRCCVPGTLYNTNTLEGFYTLDREDLLKAEAKKIWEDIHSGKVEEDGAVLCRFLLISFADLKNFKFYYRFAFPALMLDPPATLVFLKPASQWFSSEEAESVSASLKKWRNSSSTTDVPFFVVSIASNSHATLKRLKDWETSQHSGDKVLFAFYDPCCLLSNPGWPLRNYLAYLFSRFHLEKVMFFCYREDGGFPDLGVSLVGEVVIPVPQVWKNRQHMPSASGWEWKLENGKPKNEHICRSLADTMDPIRLAISAAALNIKLMKWRVLPSLKLDILSNTRCLLLGAGALGCQVARMLLAWGVMKITLVDSGSIAMSNPVRQSLYTNEDCKNGDDFKAIVAARSLKAIFPAAEAEGVVMDIPMPGHLVPNINEKSTRDVCKHLHDLIDAHDAIFLLTDSRESRWLPTLLCANANKIAISAALGSDSFMVMRHGSGPRCSNHDFDDEHLNSVSNTEDISSTKNYIGKRLACCLCNDVASVDSTTNSTLDQQCTVTRPALAPIASGLAVELLVGILHHPDGISAKAEFSNVPDSGSSEQPLGILPHQICGSLSQFSQMALAGHSSNSCTGCCSTVVLEYRKRGLDFVLQAISDPKYLEELVGLTSRQLAVVPDNGHWLSRVDPEDRLRISAAELNLRLMKVSDLPSFNPDILCNTRCLLLGAGTLGCQVARMLVAWGVRKITLVDSGKVAMSNPVRQSLYAFEDCLNGGVFKAEVAAKRLKAIFPEAEAEGVVMAIPMPGHPVPNTNEKSTLDDCKHLHDLIDAHDAIFLLTDTRESRWLPTLLCANANKPAINAALGFDSYLVMRHGSGPLCLNHNLEAEHLNSLSSNIKDSSSTYNDGRKRLGCYFCNDVVAPVDSTTNRTLDQQCTVTRPALAPIASGLAVELLVRILHHPHGISAKAEFSNAPETGSSLQPLGILPHQIRGSLSQFSHMTLVGHSSNSCTACSSNVVSEYRERGLDFLLEAINDPLYLENLSGLTELKSATSSQVDWISEDEDDDDFAVI